MSIRVETTYLATCDYPDCHMNYVTLESTEEDAILEVIDKGDTEMLKIEKTLRSVRDLLDRPHRIPPRYHKLKTQKTMEKT